MLILTRKPGESISIGNDVKVVVLRTSSGQVKLAVEVPPSVDIVRGEVERRAA